MKALRTILTAIVLLTGAMTMNAQRMSYTAMQSNARFLTDRMAYTLGISDPYLIDEIYRINYDYIWGVNDYLDDVALGYYYDDYMTVVAARDAALRNLLGYTIWNRLISYSYFYRPIVFANHRWHFSIYDYDRYGMHHFFYGAPRPIAHGYAGGRFFRPMAPVGGRRMAPAPAPGRPAPGRPAPGRPAPGRPNPGMAPRGGAPAPGMAPRGGAPAPGRPNMGATPTPRGNAPTPGRTTSSMAPRGGAPQGGAPQGGAPQGGGRSNNNVAPRTNITTPSTNTNHNMNTGSGMRSNNNMGSSSRGNGAPTRSSAPSGSIRGGGGGHSSMGGGARGGGFGGGRR